MKTLPKNENSCSNCCFNNHLLFTCSVRLELEGCDGKVAPVSKQKKNIHSSLISLEFIRNVENIIHENPGTSTSFIVK